MHARSRLRPCVRLLLLLRRRLLLLPLRLLLRLLLLLLPPPPLRPATTATTTTADANRSEMKFPAELRLKRLSFCLILSQNLSFTDTLHSPGLLCKDDLRLSGKVLTEQHFEEAVARRRPARPAMRAAKVSNSLDSEGRPFQTTASDIQRLRTRHLSPVLCSVKTCSCQQSSGRAATCPTTSFHLKF